MNDWRQAHGGTIRDFLSYLNEKSGGFILKGDTALSLCYQLDRFSEDIGLDGRRGTSATSSMTSARAGATATARQKIPTP
jgi:hypothetical protein